MGLRTAATMREAHRDLNESCTRVDYVARCSNETLNNENS
jgi:hypothetical protein